jgi:adenylyl cyclase-associated protein
MAALVTELSSKITTDGSSAATGLRNVKREQQTWRKEYNPNNSVPTLSSKPAVVVSSALSNIKVGGESKSPIFLFDTTAQKWRVEYQNGKSSTSSAGNSNSNLKIQVQDVKEQVYIYQCQNVTIEISGKCKTIVIDGCSKVQVVFGTAISSCEVVNSKRIQVQTLGVCPTFAIDKTDGCLIFLSKETMTVSSFVTSKSSEMNGKLFHAYHIRLF